MAVVALTTTEVVRAGIAPVYTGSLLTSNTYTFPLTDLRTFLHVKNTGGTICVVTVVTPGVTDGFALADHTFSVPITTGDIMAGPFRPETFADPTTGLCTCSFSFITGVTVAVVHTVVT